VVLQSGKNLLMSAAMGVLLNVQIKNVPRLNFLSWNKYLRVAFRVPLLFAPYLLFFKTSTDVKLLEMSSIHEKYFRRIQLYQRTGDTKHLDPTNALAKRLRQQQEEGL